MPDYCRGEIGQTLTRSRSRRKYRFCRIGSEWADTPWQSVAICSSLLVNAVTQAGETHASVFNDANNEEAVCRVRPCRCRRAALGAGPADEKADLPRRLRSLEVHSEHQGVPRWRLGGLRPRPSGW